MPISDRDIVEALKAAGHSQADAIARVNDWRRDREAVVILQQSLRDNMAMAALTGMLANPHGCGDRHVRARDAYEMANAMLRARGAA